MTALCLENVSVVIRPHFWSRPRQILRDVSLAVPRGQIVGFLGPNGAGKTTTIKTVLGLLRPERGAVTIFGRPAREREARRALGYMPERAYFPEQLTARELVALHGRLAGVSERELGHRVAAVLERVGLGAAMDQRLHGYSKGMLQRAGLAQALVGEPELVILDEPMSGLDPLGRRDVRELMVELRARGKTVFFSTHILPDVEAICDQVAIIAGGQLQRCGSLAELLGDRSARVEVWCAPIAEALAAEVAPGIASRREQSGELCFTVDTLAQANALVDRLRARGVELRGLQLQRGTLEDLFLDQASAARPATSEVA